MSGGFFEGVALTDGVAYLAVDCRRCKAIEQRWPLKSQRQSQSQSNQRRMSDERCKLLQHCTPNGIIIIVSGGASVVGGGQSYNYGQRCGDVSWRCKSRVANGKITVQVASSLESRRISQQKYRC